jgi:hypothetical protein
MQQKNIWDQLAARCYISCACAKKYAYLVSYGWDEDPWPRAILLNEMGRLRHPTQDEWHGVS